MFYLKHLRIQQFKNYTQGDFEFIPGVNCITGKNGSGKTNLLDALYYLSFTKSYFFAQDQQHVQHGQTWMRLEGVYERNQLEEQVVLTWQNGTKSLQVNNNAVKRFSDHIGQYPLVMIVPNDILLILEGSEERRKFLDGLLAQSDATYLMSLLAYNRVLEQRNRLLKSIAEGQVPDALLMESYNEQLITHGTLLYEKRAQFLKDFVPVFRKQYATLCGTDEPVHIQYESELSRYSMAELLALQYQADWAALRTTKGPHRDDLEFQIGDFSLKKRGSQGQQKSFIIALKLAQYEYLKMQSGLSPLLLLDDIFEKLDGQRLQLLLSKVTQEPFGQLFITDTHKERLQQVLNGLPVEVNYIALENGRIAEI